jgi:hypothetical protein
MKIRQFLIICSIITTSLSAQDIKPPRESYFFLGIGLPLVKVRDEAHSPLMYRGFIPTLRLGHESINGDYVSRMTVSASFGTTKPKTRPKPERVLSSMEMSYLQLNYTYYSRLYTYHTEGWNQYLGGALTLTLDTRSYNLPSNNLIGYQVNMSLNVGGFTQKQLKNAWRYNYEIFTPVVSYSLRPTYLGMLPMTGADIKPKSFFSNGKIVTVDKLFRLYNRFSFDEQVKSYRQRRLFYSWDFQSNTVSKPLKSIVTGIGYEMLFKM